MKEIVTFFEEDIEKPPLRRGMRILFLNPVTLNAPQCVKFSERALKGAMIVYIELEIERNSSVAVDVEAFYTKYGPMVMRRCKFLLRNEEEALDAMQETFVQVLRRQDVLHDSAPSSLLYRIATNVCLNMMRKQNRAFEMDGGDIIDSIAGDDKPEARVLTNHFLDRIFKLHKDSTRAIAVYHFVDKMTLEETAELVGLSVSGVRKRLRVLKETGLALKEV